MFSRVGFAGTRLASRPAVMPVCMRQVRVALNANQFSLYGAVGIRQQSTAASGALSWIRRNVTLTNLKTYYPQIAAGAGALVVLYGISSAAVHVATVLLELDMKQVFYIGFLTGVGTSATIALVGIRAYRHITIQPDAVYRAALHKLMRNTVVRSELGQTLRSGHLKAYTLHPGHLSMEKKLGWVDPRVQLLFQVVGDKGEGMVTAEAVKHNGTLGFTLLAVDTLPTITKPKSVLVLVAGKEEKLHVRGTLRGFLQTERAQYVAQDRTEHDDDRLDEQEHAAPAEPVHISEGTPLSAASTSTVTSQPAAGEQKLQ